MSHFAFPFRGEILHALASGALYWPSQKLLCVSDLHFGKAQRYAQHGASPLPPYEVHETLERLEKDITQTKPETLICLGDSFDHLGASDDLDHQARDWIARLQRGLSWIWIEGNHDPDPTGHGGSHLKDCGIQPLIFRHISQADDGASGEVSGHYHPKATIKTKGRAITRRCFIVDSSRLVMPAYGTYTGGLSVNAKPLNDLFAANALCILTGPRALPIQREKLT